MEIFELRYFLEVAKLENIHRASEHLYVSPGSLSKAISRLEQELDCTLFHRRGRNIKLSPAGHLLKIRATELLRLEENTRFEISGKEGEIHVVVCGPEILLSYVGTQIIDKISKKSPKASFEFITLDEQAALSKIEKNEAHIAITTTSVANGLNSKSLGTTQFQTVIGRAHPLYKLSKASIPVETVLKHSFVSAKHPIFGKVAKNQSPDGWRDDEFPRKIDFVTTSLTLMKEIIESGKAIAYLPDYLIKQLDVVTLKVKGCPYKCEQNIKAVTKNPSERSWLKSYFQS